MTRLPLAWVAAALACTAGVSHAQANPAPAMPPPDVGFFRPQPGEDPSLFHTLPPEAYAPAASASTPAANAAPMVVVVPAPYVAAPSPEEQLDRAQLEAQRAQAAAIRPPTPINGAFTGLTDERYR